MTPPDISRSTRAERLDFIIHAFRCLADCDNCGHCQFLHGRNAVDVYHDYIEGVRSFCDVTMDWNRQS